MDTTRIGISLHCSFLEFGEESHPGFAGGTAIIFAIMINHINHIIISLQCTDSCYFINLAMMKIH